MAKASKKSTTEPKSEAGEPLEAPKSTPNPEAIKEKNLGAKEVEQRRRIDHIENLRKQMIAKGIDVSKNIPAISKFNPSTQLRYTSPSEGHPSGTPYMEIPNYTSKRKGGFKALIGKVLSGARNAFSMGQATEVKKLNVPVNIKKKPKQKEEISSSKYGGMISPPINIKKK